MKKKILIAVLIVVIALFGVLNVKLEFGNDNDYQRALTIGNVVTISIGPETALAATNPDYTCDGVDDNVQFQQALNALPANGGKLLVLGGQYNFASSVTRAIDNVVLEGVGYSSYFVFNGAADIFTVGGNRWLFKDIRFDNGGVGYATFTDTKLNGCWVGSTYNPSITGKNAIVVAASNSSDIDKISADYVCDGTADEVQIQAAISDAETKGGGEILCTAGDYTMASGINFTPLNQSASIKFVGYGAVLDHTGTDDLIEIATNISVSGGTRTATERTVTIEGFYMTGNATSDAAIDMTNCNKMMVNNVKIEDFDTGFGIRIMTTLNNYWSEQNYVGNSNIVNCRYPLVTDSDFDVLDNTRFENLVLQGSNTDPSYDNTGTQSPERSQYTNIVAKVGVANATCWDFGSGDWRETILESCSCEANWNNATGYTSTASRNPMIENQNAPLISGSGTGQTLFAGTMQDWYDTNADDLITNPHFADATLLIPYKTGSGAFTRDYSSNNEIMTLVNTPTWGTDKGLLGNLDIASGSNEYLSSSSLSMDGDWSLVMYFNPDYNYNDATSHYFWYWFVDANNFISMNKDAGNQYWCVAKGNNQEANLGFTPNFTSGDDLIIVATMDESAGTLTLYENGILVGTGTNGAYNQSATEASFWIGATPGPANLNDGQLSFNCIVPRIYTPSEVVDVTRQVAEMMDLNMSLPEYYTEGTNYINQTADANGVYLITRDKGGKTEIIAVFSSGTVSVAIQP